MGWLENNIEWISPIIVFLGLLGIQFSPIKINPFTLLGKILGWLISPIKNYLVKEMVKKVENSCKWGVLYQTDSKKLEELTDSHKKDMKNIFEKMETLLEMTLETKVDRLFDNIRIIKKYFVECDEQLIAKGYLTREQYKQIFKYEQDYDAVKEKLKKLPDEVVPREHIPNGEVRPMLKKFHDAYQNNLIK